MRELLISALRPNKENKYQIFSYSREMCLLLLVGSLRFRSQQESSPTHLATHIYEMLPFFSLFFSILHPSNLFLPSLLLSSPISCFL